MDLQTFKSIKFYSNNNKILAEANQWIIIAQNKVLQKRLRLIADINKGFPTLSVIEKIESKIIH